MMSTYNVRLSFTQHDVTWHSSVTNPIVTQIQKQSWMKICSSGTGIVLIFQSLFSFWFGRKRRISRTFDKLSNHLDEFLIKIPLGWDRNLEVPDEWESWGSAANALRLLAFPTCTTPATYPTCCQVAQHLKFRTLSLHVQPATKPAQILTKCVQAAPWEINIWAGVRLPEHDFSNLRASTFLSRKRTTQFCDNCGCDPKHIQDRGRILVTYSCLWVSRLHCLAEVTTYCRADCNDNKLPMKP